jgi:hypothetical protein
MYLGFTWLPNDDKILALPAHSFFGTNVITADNIEYGVYSQSVSAVSKYVEFLLTRGDEIDNFGELLSPLNVRYVILVHEADFLSYGYLQKQQDLQVVLDRPGVTLFRNTYAHGPVYAVGAIKPLADLEELIKVSRTEDILSSVYELGTDATPRGPGVDTGSVPEFPAVQRTHPARLKVAQSKKPYTVFVTEYAPTARHWRFGDKSPEAMNLGMMPVYSGDGSANTLYFSRWTWLLALDSLALFVAAVSVGYLLWHRFKPPVAGEDSQ